MESHRFNITLNPTKKLKKKKKNAKQKKKNQNHTEKIHLCLH